MSFYLTVNENRKQMDYVLLLIDVAEILSTRERQRKREEGDLVVAALSFYVFPKFN